MDWIEESQRMVSIHQNCLREPLNTVNVVCFYINKQNTVENTFKTNLSLDTSNHSISKEELLHFIQKNKKNTPMTRYTLKDTCVFHIPIEPERVASFQQTSYQQFWSSYPIVDTIQFSPSIFIFHPYSTIYFFYYEEDKPTIKSLKTALKTNSHHNITKRVRWDTKSSRPNATRKSQSILSIESNT